MDTIVEFLLARIAEDEAMAQSCPPWPWRVATEADDASSAFGDIWAGETVVAGDGVKVAEPFALSGPQTRAVRDHVARFDPARVLAECEAKRAMVSDWYGYTTGDWYDRPLRWLALPYADHPDYRDEWRP